MNFFHKTLASFGIGSAKVDTRLAKSAFCQGEKIYGEVFIQGGNSDQQVDEIYLFLVVQYYRNQKKHEYVIDNYSIAEPFVIHAMETKTFPFEFQLPYDIPITTKNSLVFFKTGLDIKLAVDPDDIDGFEVLPHPFVDRVMEAIEDMGFRLDKIEFDFEHFYSSYPFVQLYRFLPEGKYADFMDELAFVFYPYEHELDVIMQMDQKAIDLITSMKEALDLDEKLVRFSFTDKELQEGKEAIKKKLEKHLDLHLG